MLLPVVMLLINPWTFRTSVGIGPYWLLKKYQHQFVPPCDDYLFPFMGNIPFLSQWCWFCLLVIHVPKSPYGCQYVCQFVCQYVYQYCYLLIVNHFTVIIKEVVLPPTHAAIIFVWYAHYAFLFCLICAYVPCMHPLSSSVFETATLQVLATPSVDSREKPDSLLS